ncbi:MFS transporter [Kitasatospora sp. NA04385]|uniref:MFS transporter n=1 Tax=Kitasatospora sp. NA04385 TaxID=2742135 RepID=UPI0015910983|nr:MFS transporter [Kitasatospora sp. NA04385]QKW19621.1 MFS transporter [Kitasatospora sp. NA04385]
MRPRASAPPPVALYAAGQLPAYLLPTLVGRLTGGAGLTPTQAGALGSTLLLASATVALLLAGRVAALGPGRTARAGLALLGLGCALVATGPQLPLLTVALAVAGLGGGAATAVATTAIAGTSDPHRATVRALLATSGTAAGLYLLLPHLGGGPAAPFTALALAALVAAATRSGRLRTGPARVGGPERKGRPRTGPQPRTVVTPGDGGRRAATALILAVPFWSMAQNALWGISGQLGHRQAGLGEGALGLVFALALLGGLLGVTAAGLLGTRVGRTAPIGLGTLVIAGCVLLTGTARGPAAFTTGELLWNLLYPLVLSHLLGLAAALDPSGRRAVQTSAASALGIACGPLVGTALAGGLGYPGAGAVLAALLAASAGPLVLAARPRGLRRPAASRSVTGRPTRRRVTVRRRPGSRPATAHLAAHPAARVPGRRRAASASRPEGRPEGRTEGAVPRAAPTARTTPSATSGTAPRRPPRTAVR